MRKTRVLLLAAILSLGSFSALGKAGSLVDLERPDKGPKYGKDSVTCVVNISLYREFFKQWKNSGYKADRAVHDAIVPWRWVFLNCPMGTENTYIDGTKIIEYRIGQEKDEAKRQLLIDTMMLLYDQRIEHFGKEGYVLGRKGVDLYQYRPEAFEQVYSTLKRSVDLEGTKTASAVLVYYFRATLAMIEAQKIDISEALDVYNQIEGITEYYVKAGGSKAEGYAQAWSNIELSGGTVFGCDELVPSFTRKLEAEPENIDLLRKITTMLDAKGCTDSEVYFKATLKLYEADPTPESAFLIGKMYYKRGSYGSAAKYLSQATDMTDSSALADNYLLLATTYLHQQQYSNGRSAALNAARLRPGDGRPYLLIGDMYAGSASDCGDNKLTKKVAFWAAVDKYYRAKAVDSSLESEANQKISTYSAYFPVMEDIFFYGLNEGDSYTVGCWINETTTVRAVK
ncbi:MAG: hypothetical protein IH599_05390 [Bacteroidales bacterium]|nr:hypothetical protein [Bacteroidales bacterium]